MKTIELYECGSEGRSGRRTVALTMEREQLIYDVRNLCFVEGHIMEGAETGDPSLREARHMVQDVGEEGNVDRVTRVLDMTAADLTEKLFPFTRRDVVLPIVDDRLRERKVYGFFLDVPEDYSQTTLNLLGELIHEVMVCMAVADWMSITNPQKEDTWRGKAERAMARINEVKNSRGSRRRIRGHYLG